LTRLIRSDTLVLGWLDGCYQTEADWLIPQSSLDSECVMDRRKRILSNMYEIAAHKALQEAVDRCGAKVYAKVRVADALDINGSGLGPEEYTYALKAHFDFVIARDDESAAFAVEFDGRSHDLNAKVISRDALKNAICEQLGMPLLRIDDIFLGRVGRFSVLGWLVEVWFMNEAFKAAQESGSILTDEIFDPYMVIALGYREGDQIIEVDAASYGKASREMTPEAFDAFGATFGARLVPFQPYALSSPARALMDRFSRVGICHYPPEMLRATDPKGYRVAVALLSLSEGGVVVGTGRLRPFDFVPGEASELSEELAVFDAGEKLKRYLQGKHRPATVDEVNAWRASIAKWREYK